MKKRSYLAGCFSLYLLLFNGSNLAALEQDHLISVGATYFPTVSLDQPANSIFPDDLKIGITTVEISLKLPSFYQGRDVRIFHGLFYNIRNISYENWDESSGLYQPDQLQGTEYRLGFIRELSKSWDVTAILRPGVYSDFGQAVSSDDFRFQAIALFDHYLDNKMTFGFGFQYSNLFGDELPLPVLHLESPPEAKYNLDVLLPERALLTYRIGGKSEIGIAAHVKGSKYHIEGTLDTPATLVDRVEYSAGTVGPHARINLTKAISLFLDTGTTFFRRFELKKDDEKVNEFEFDQSFFFRATLALML
jgi:hypothetical protein